MHLDLSYFTTKEAVVVGFKSHARMKERMKELQLNASVLKAQPPLIFIDRSGNSLLPEAVCFLCSLYCSVDVLITTKRFVNKWRNGSFAEELKCDDGGVSPYAMYRSSGPGSKACPLLKIVHWTRMVIDKGHVVMGRGRQNAIIFALWISSSQRWSMTGTLTPQMASQSGMPNLLPLRSGIGVCKIRRMPDPGAWEQRGTLRSRLFLQRRVSKR
jgi:hypothetical protein